MLPWSKLDAPFIADMARDVRHPPEATHPKFAKQGAAPLPTPMPSNLPTTEQFFAAGTENTLAQNCVKCIGDVHRLGCEPQGFRGLCHTAYNCCAGGGVGTFIWPLGCPCGCCTCCCPLKTLDGACCVCKTPEERCDSLRYQLQRFLASGVHDAQEIWPLPPGTAERPVSERDTYAGRDGPWSGAHPNRFVSWLESMGDLMTSLAFLAPCCIAFNRCTVAPNTTHVAASKYVGQHDAQMDDNANFGGVWVYPRAFKQLPTPPHARGADGKPLSTNVQPGQPGSRVIFWAHGSAFAITQVVGPQVPAIGL